jgi:hypothetical protein
MNHERTKQETHNLRLKLLMPGKVLQDKWGKEILVCRAVYSYLAYRDRVGASQREIAQNMCLGRRKVRRAVELLGPLVKATGRSTTSRYWAEKPNDDDFLPARSPNAKHWRDSLAYLYVEIIPEIGLRASVYQAAKELLANKPYQTNQGIAKFVGCHPTSINTFSKRALCKTEAPAAYKPQTLYEKCLADCGTEEFVWSQIGFLVERLRKLKGSERADAEVVAKRAEHDANMKEPGSYKKNHFLAYLKNHLNRQITDIERSVTIPQQVKIKPPLLLVVYEINAADDFLAKEMVKSGRSPTEVEMVNWLARQMISPYYVIAERMSLNHPAINDKLELYRESWDLLTEAERSQILNERSQILLEANERRQILDERSQNHTYTKDNTKGENNKSSFSASPNQVATLEDGKTLCPKLSASEECELVEFFATVNNGEPADIQDPLLCSLDKSQV